MGGVEYLCHKVYVFRGTSEFCEQPEAAGSINIMIIQF